MAGAESLATAKPAFARTPPAFVMMAAKDSPAELAASSVGPKLSMNSGLSRNTRGRFSSSVRRAVWGTELEAAGLATAALDGATDGEGRRRRHRGASRRPRRRG